MQHDAGIDAAAARAHDKPVEGGETHRRVDAAPALHCAQAGAVAEVRGNHTPARERRIDLAQTPCDIFIRKTMKAVAADTLIVEEAGDGEPGGDHRLVMVEGRVEADDLRKIGVDP